jgi:altronate dehydratase small subunit
MKHAILINEKDNVAVVMENVTPDEVIAIVDLANTEYARIKPLQSILFRHKIAIRTIPRHESIVKYGEIIGRAKKDIKIGDWVHVHNVSEERMS